MAKCKICGRSGLFLSLNEDGLCKSCAQKVVNDIQERFRIIKESMKLAMDSENIKTKLFKCDTIIKQATALMEYENKGISTIEPAPAELIKEFTNIKEEILLESKGPPICPYCNKTLEKFPGSKKRCPFCGEYIYVRSDPKTGKKVLVTKEQTKKIKKEYDEIRSIKYWKEDLKSLGITEKDYQVAKKKSKSPFERDVIWSLFGKLAHENMKEGDFQALRQIYYSQALFLYEEGKDPFRTLQESARMALIDLKNSGIIEVEISGAGNGCPECQKLNGKVYKIEDALKEMPIPNKNCTLILGDGDKPFCRCLWIAHFKI